MGMTAARLRERKAAIAASLPPKPQQPRALSPDERISQMRETIRVLREENAHLREELADALAAPLASDPQEQVHAETQSSVDGAQQDESQPEPTPVSQLEPAETPKQEQRQQGQKSRNRGR